MVGYCAGGLLLKDVSAFLDSGLALWDLDERGVFVIVLFRVDV